MNPTADPPPVLFEPVLTPRGHLLLVETAAPSGLDATLAARLVEAFTRGLGEGLLQLGAGEVSTPLPPAFGFWRDFASRFVIALCAQPDAASAEPGRSAHGSISPAIAPPSDADLDAIAAAAPPMTGAEYLTPDVLRDLWLALDTAFTARLTDAPTTVQDVLRAFNPAWNTVGRVHFHLAENRRGA